jgi:DNA polymerase V
LIGPARIEPSLVALPIGTARAVLGFPSPADDFADGSLDLNELLVRNPPATFLYQAAGRSMELAGIFDGDLLVVDRSETPQDTHIVVATWEGNAPSCKVLSLRDDHIELESRDRPRSPNIVLPPETEIEVFVVTGVVRLLRRKLGRLGR